MAEVPGAPYEPFPTAQPTERPIPLAEPRISGAAFGENIANAVRTFGGDVQTAGNEVAERAMALRQLQVDGAIRDINTAAYQEVAPEQAQFLAAQQNGAGPDQLNAHLAKIDQIRAKYAGMASQYGIYGQNKFGEDFASMQKSLTIEASAHSAGQTRQASINGNKAYQDTLVRSFNSNNPADFDRTIAKGEESIDQNSALDREGNPPDVVTDQKVKFRQDLREKQIGNMAWDKPEIAMGMLSDPAIQQDLGDKYGTVRKEVENRYETVVGGRLAVYAADHVKMGMSEDDAVNGARVTVEQDPVASQIPGMADRVEQQTRAHIRGVNYDINQSVETSKQYILTTLSAPGANYKNLAEVEAANPNIKAAEQGLRQNAKGALWLAGLNSYVQHNWQKAHTEDMDDNYKYLLGLSYSRDPDNRQKFLQDSADLSKYELTRGGWSAIIKRRDTVLNHPEQMENPIVKQALSLSSFGALAETRRQLGITKETDANHEKYNKFTGGLGIAIDEWMNANDHQVPSEKDLKETIIPKVLNETIEPGRVFGTWWGTKRGAFDLDVSKQTMAEAKQLEADRRTRVYGERTTPENISDQDAYASLQRAYFGRLFGKSSDGGNTTTVPKSR